MSDFQLPRDEEEDDYQDYQDDDFENPGSNPDPISQPESSKRNQSEPIIPETSSNDIEEVAMQQPLEDARPQTSYNNGGRDQFKKQRQTMEDPREQIINYSEQQQRAVTAGNSNAWYGNNQVPSFTQIQQNAQQQQQYQLNNPRHQSVNTRQQNQAQYFYGDGGESTNVPMSLNFSHQQQQDNSSPMRSIQQQSFFSGQRRRKGAPGHRPFFNQSGNHLEAEDLKNQSNQLKRQMNTIFDENVKLKTRLQFLTAESQSKDAVIEDLSKKLDQVRLNTGGKLPSNFFESFLVQSLKKQVREQREIISERDFEVDQLKKSMKTTKISELEIEMQQYIEECTRLRTMLDQTLSQLNELHNMRYENQMTSQNQELIADAFNQKEKQIMLEKQLVVDLESQLFQERSDKDKLKARMQDIEKKNKKVRQIMEENRRKQKIIEDKKDEIKRLTLDLERYKEKAFERDKAVSKNAEFVTRQYAYQAQLDSKEKTIQELRDRVNQIMTAPPPVLKPPPPTQNPATSYTTEQGSHHKSVSKKPSPPKSQSSKLKPTQAVLEEILFRAVHGKPITLSTDTDQMKSYYNNNKTKLEKEIVELKTLKKDENISKALEKLKLVQFEKGVANIQDIDILLEKPHLGLSDREKKYLKYWILFKAGKTLQSVNWDDLSSRVNQTSQEVKEPELIETQSPAKQTEHDDEEPIIKDEPHTTIGAAAAAQVAEPAPQKDAEEDSYQDDQFEEQPDEEKKLQEQYLKDMQNFVPPGEQQKKPATENEEEEMDEEQLLNVAETVFKRLGQALTGPDSEAYLRALVDRINLLEDSQNGQYYEFVEAEPFLDWITKIISDLSDLEISCVMRVLGKEELYHAILIDEFRMVMDNFGFKIGLEDILAKMEKEEEALKQTNEQKPPEPVSEQAQAEPVAKKAEPPAAPKENPPPQKQRTNTAEAKKKQRRDLLSNNEEVFSFMKELIDSSQSDFSKFKGIIEPKIFQQEVKHATKTAILELIKTADFFQQLEEGLYLEASQTLKTLVGQLIYLDKKHPELVSVKSLSIFYKEAASYIKENEEEKQKIEAFYGADGGGEVMAFGDDLEKVSEDDDELASSMEKKHK